jgi:hypothetical protein
MNPIRIFKVNSNIENLAYAIIMVIIVVDLSASIVIYRHGYAIPIGDHNISFSVGVKGAVFPPRYITPASDNILIGVSSPLIIMLPWVLGIAICKGFDAYKKERANRSKNTKT